MTRFPPTLVLVAVQLDGTRVWLGLQRAGRDMEATCAMAFARCRDVSRIEVFRRSNHHRGQIGTHWGTVVRPDPV